MTELTKRMCTLLKWERQAMCDGRKRAWKAFRHERAQLTAKASRIEIEGYNRWLDALESTSAQAA